MSLMERQIIRDPLQSYDELRVRFVQIVSALAISFILTDIVIAITAGRSIEPSGFVWVFFFAGLFASATRKLFLDGIVNAIVIALTIGVFIQPDPMANLGVSALVYLAGALFVGRFTFLMTSFSLIGRAIWLEIPFFNLNYSFFSGILPYMVALFVVSFLLRIVRSRLQELILSSRRTSELLSASAIIGQVIGQYLDLKPLLNRSVEIVRDRLGYYHVQIFLTDANNDFAVLTAATGDMGKVLLAQGRKLSVNTNTLVGRALQVGEALIARETNNREDYTFPESLPNTRSELVMPILDGEKIIGVIDIHSMRSGAFNRTDVQALEVMANQLATAIRNARLFEQQENTIRENKRLFLESETNLREIERLNRQMTKQAWEEYLRGRGVLNGVTWSQREFKPGAEWTTSMAQAAQRRRVVSQSDANKKRRVVAVPVELRGEVVGAIEIETNETTFSNDSVDMLQAISQRLAVSLDNARLFEETQEATAQEQRISEIVSGYQSAESIEDLLQITLQGLTEALGADKGMIRLGNVPTGGQA